MTAPTSKVGGKPAPKPSVGEAAAEAVPLPGTVTHLGFDWDPEATPIGYAVAVELSAWLVPAAT